MSAPRNTIAISSIIASLFTLGVLGCSSAASTDPLDLGEGDELRVDAIRNPTSTASNYPETALLTMDNGWICSGSVIAPRVVLTAGHCVDGHNSFSITTPYAKGSNGQPQERYASGKWTNYKSTGEYVNPDTPDVGLLFVDTPFTMPVWPKVSSNTHYNEQAVNVGRINNGSASYSNLYVGVPLTLTSQYGFPYSYGYASSGVTQSGDSGGPMFLNGTHTIVAVCSGGGVAGRTDTVYSTIDELVRSHGGYGGQSTDPTDPTDPADPTDPTDPGDGCQYSCSEVGFIYGDCGQDQNGRYWKCDGTCLNQVSSCGTDAPDTPDACNYYCSDYGFKPGDCVNDDDNHVSWECDGTCLNQVSSCGSPPPDTPGTCDYYCSDFGFEPGQCEIDDHNNVVWECDGTCINLVSSCS